MKKNLKTYLSTLFAFFILSNISAQTTWYVMPSASGSGNGSSWANASADLQSILTNATTGDKVWVAAGVYKPTVDPSGANDPRRRSFLLKSGVKVYGGFAGNETLLSQRDWNTNLTTLSGDFNGDDGPNFANNSENAFIVAMSFNCDTSTTLDGFTVADGNANANGSYSVSGYTVDGNSGAGMQNSMGSNFTISNCTFTRGSALTYSGGVYNFSAAMTFNNCIISYNQAGYVCGGIYSFGLSGNANLTMNNCVIIGNSAAAACGGVSARIALLSLNNCLVIGNAAPEGAGVYIIVENQESSGLIKNCTFYNNMATVGGAFIGDQTTVYNCIFDSNTGAGFEFKGFNGSSVNNSVIGTNNTFDNNGNTSTFNCVNANPYFVNTADLDGADNLWGTADDGLMIGCASAALNIGDNNNAIATDIIGTARPQFGTADAGAYESENLGDNSFINASICLGDTYSFNGQSFSTDGVYSDTLSNINGCDSIVTLTLTVNLLPSLTFSLPDSVCSTAAALVLNGAPAGGTYSGSTALSGNSFDPAAAALGTNLVTYQFTDANGCSATTSDSMQVLVCLTGTNLTPAEAMINLYPNPATNQLFIETGNMTVTEINIYNINGSLVSTLNATQVSYQLKSLDISQLISGVYIAEIKTKEASVKMRWVKM